MGTHTPTTPPRRRLDGTVRVSADSRADLAVHLMQLATELMLDWEGPESVDRYTVTEGATSRIRVNVEPDITAESYAEALRQWGHDTVRNHPRADHRAAALDSSEPF